MQADALLFDALGYIFLYNSKKKKKSKNEL